MEKSGETGYGFSKDNRGFKSVGYEDYIEPVVLPKKPKVIATDNGPVTIEGPVSSDFLTEMLADEGLKNFRPAERQLEALVSIAEMDEGKVIIARHGQKLVGYVTFHPPEEFERWGETDMEEILELGAIEVAPAWRSGGVAKGLLATAFAAGWVEDFIIIATEYYWHWDTEGSKLSVWGYRKLMEKLFTPFGLKPMDTDDPEICSHPANALMVRIGSRVKKEAVTEFDSLRFLNR